MNQTNPARIDDACGMYAGAALLFSFSGLSFGVSRRILGIAETLVRQAERGRREPQETPWVRRKRNGSGQFSPIARRRPAGTSREGNDARNLVAAGTRRGACLLRVAPAVRHKSCEVLRPARTRAAAD